MLRYVTKYGKLKTAFLSLEEKLLFGSDGQWECLQRSLGSLYPKSGFVNPGDIIPLILKKHELQVDAEDMEVEEIEPIENKIDRMDAPF